MKKIIFKTVVAVASIIFALLLMSPGCRDEGDHNVGYYYIAIPGFKEADYIPMLSSSNEEMQYNAICYFTAEGDYDRYLTTDSLKETTKHDTALLLYHKIYSLMDSKNTWVSSAAIRFISAFDYNRPAFMHYLLKNNHPSLNVQLEIVMDLIEDTAKDQTLLVQKIDFLQQHPSWLLQNGAYLLIDKKDSFSLNRLMNEYNSSSEEYKKLLILDVLTDHITDSVFSFLASEWAVTKNEQIKKIIISSIGKAHNQQQAFDWFDVHDNILKEQMKQLIGAILNEETNELPCRLIVLALKKGWEPSSIISGIQEGEYSGEPVLYISLFDQKYSAFSSDSISQKYSPGAKRIEEALLQHPQLKKEWLAFEKKMFRYSLPQDMVEQHRQLTATYLQQTRLLLQQCRIDTALSNEFAKEISRSVDQLHKEKIRKQE